MTEQFKELLQKLRELDAEDPHEFELQAIKLFINYLEGDDLNLYHQPSFRSHEAHIRPDAMLAKSRDGKPLFIIEVKKIRNRTSSRFRHEWMHQITSYIHASGAEYGILLSNRIFSILDEDDRLDIDLDNLDEESIEEAENLLNSADISGGRQERYEESPGQIESRYFSLDSDEFDEAVNWLDEAESSHDKGEAFEDLASLLFGGIEFLTVRDKQLRTNTGEIDVVVEYDGHSEKTIFDGYSRFILAECKNWSGTVGVPQIRDFKGKMDKSYTNFGVIFAREGISGDEGADAIRWIHDYFQREGSVILVIDDDELARIRSGEGFYNILDDLLYERRFDLSI